MDSVDNFVVPKQNPVGLEGPRKELGLYFTCKDMEKMQGGRREKENTTHVQHI